jgi:hypothetical protein
VGAYWKSGILGDLTGADRYTIGRNGSAFLMVQNNGNVGIGTTAPDQLLTVNGNASKPGGGSFVAFSDRRLKQNIQNFTPGLAELMQLRTVSYEYRPDNELGINAEGTFTGFVAQEVQQVLPMAVTETQSGYLQLNTDPIVWTMLNAIQEQQRVIEQLRAEVQQLQATAQQPTGAQELHAQMQDLRQQIEALNALISQLSSR